MQSNGKDFAGLDGQLLRSASIPPRRSAAGVLRAPSERQRIFGQLNEVGLIERGDDRVEVQIEQRQERVVRDVASGENE